MYLLFTAFAVLHWTVARNKQFIISLYCRNWRKAAKSLCTIDEAKEFRLDDMEEEIATLENELTGKNQRIGFCHNDLQYGNIMIDEETSLVTIIVSSLTLVHRLEHEACVNLNDFAFRIMNMRVSTPLHLILRITFVRWLLITIRTHLMFWILKNTQVHCLLVFG